MSSAIADACVRAENMAKDVRDTVTVLRLALTPGSGGLHGSEVQALHHVISLCEMQANDAVMIAGVALAHAEGRAV